ncbi:MAG: hypothetical protein K0R61_154 [Microvirga sp.]|jgi:hypothetical protein|nr:hypothetical protein [Microvirga sp.]
MTLSRPIVRLPDGRHAEILRKHVGIDHYTAVIRPSGRRGSPGAKVTIRPDGCEWAVVRENSRAAT